jgi:high-affinity iron transporter
MRARGWGKALRIAAGAGVAVLCAFGMSVARAAADGDAAAVILHELAYVSVDYPAVVKGGQVTNQDEYAEQLEFAQQVRRQIDGLRQIPERAGFQRGADDLVAAISARRSGDEVAALATRLSRGIVSAYGVVTAPSQPPDVARGRALFADNCAVCHGASGAGDGPQAAALTPRPSNFHDAARFRGVTPYALYNSISLGVAGTAMPAFSRLPEADRWALAFVVASHAAGDAERARGSSLAGDPAAAGRFPDFAAVTGTSLADAQRSGGADAAALLAHLIAHPESLASKNASPLEYSAHTLDRSAAAYAAGDKALAQQLAVSAYLEGFELVERNLETVDASLRTRVEKAMLGYRGLLQSGASPDAVRAEVGRLKTMLAEVAATLEQSKTSSTTNFLSALVILLREGIEVILIMGGIAAFLIKTNRRDGLVYLHAGWIAALALGVLTWYVASRFISVSGASRELTEGVTSIISAVVLLFVGYWLHGKSYASKWQDFIRAQMKGAMSGGTLGTIGFLSFFTVYREVFETVLFYQALWIQVGDAGHASVLYGIGVAFAIVAAAAWAVFRFGVRLPIRQFFAVSSAMIAVLAVVFTGKGIAALQEAGKFPLNPIDFPRVPLLGIYPNLEGLVLQSIVLLLLLAGYFYTHVSARKSETRAGVRAG